MFLCYFARGFHEAEELKTTYFQGKREEFVGEWMERNNLNLQTECASMIRTRIQIYFCKRNREKFFQSSNLEFRSFEQKPRARNNTFYTNQRKLTFDLPHPLTPGTETPSNSLASNNSPPPGPKGWTCPGACPRGMVTGPIKPRITAKPPQAKRRFHSHGQQRSKLCKFI